MLLLKERANEELEIEAQETATHPSRSGVLKEILAKTLVLQIDVLRCIHHPTCPSRYGVYPDSNVLYPPLHRFPLCPPIPNVDLLSFHARKVFPRAATPRRRAAALRRAPDRTADPG